MISFLAPPQYVHTNVPMMIWRQYFLQTPWRHSFPPTPVLYLYTLPAISRKDFYILREKNIPFPEAVSGAPPIPKPINLDFTKSVQKIPPLHIRMQRNLGVLSNMGTPPSRFPKT